MWGVRTLEILYMVWVTMAENKKIVRVSEVTKDFDLGKIVVKVLKGIDLEIESGKYVSIMGPSGSGKSTLFNMIGGLDKPTSGKVFIDEVDIAHSYYVVPKEENVVATETEYGVPFCSMIWRDNVVACQFHPEKSQSGGLMMLKNFAESC